MIIIVAIALIILLLLQRQVEEGFTDTTDRVEKIKDPEIYTNKHLPNPIQEGPLKGNPNLTWNDNTVATKWIKDIKGYLPSI